MAVELKKTPAPSPERSDHASRAEALHLSFPSFVFDLESSEARRVEPKSESKAPVKDPKEVKKDDKPKQDDRAKSREPFGPPAPSAAVQKAAALRREALYATRAEKLYDCFFGKVFMHFSPEGDKALEILKAVREEHGWNELSAAWTEVCRAHEVTRFGHNDLGAFLQVNLSRKHLKQYLALSHSKEAVKDAERLDNTLDGIGNLRDCIYDICGYDEDKGTMTKAGAMRLLRARRAFDDGYQHQLDRQWGIIVGSMSFDLIVNRHSSRTSLQKIMRLAKETAEAK